MTLFEILIICIVAAMFVATIFMFSIYIQNIKKLHVLESKITTMSNVAFECRSFLEKLSKHDVIVKINNIGGLEKKIGEVIGICKNQTNNINSVKESLDNAMDDIRKRNNLIVDNHKLLDNINGKLIKTQNSINNVEEFSESITYIKEKVGEVSVDSEKEIIKINDKLDNICPNINKNIFTSYEDIKEKLLKVNQQYTIISNSINATSEFIKTINDELNNFSDSIDNVIKNNKINNDEIAKISSILDTYREKVNYMTTWIENATKLKTASKSKIAKTKTTTTPIIKK